MHAATFLADTLQRARVYTDRRVLAIFLLGVIQGLPWVMIGSMLTLWLQEAGVSRANIGYATLIFTVYAINFLWSPLVEGLTPPLGKQVGQRQSWIVASMALIALLCLGLSQLDSAREPALIVLLCFFVALLSATQDIAIDAYRVDSFRQEESREIAAAAAAVTSGWWTGYAGLGALPLMLSDHGWAWPQLYALLGALCALLAIAAALLPSPVVHHRSRQQTQQREIVAQLASVPPALKQRLAHLVIACGAGLSLCLAFALGAPFGLLSSFSVLAAGTVLTLGSIVALCLQLNALPTRSDTAAAEATQGGNFERILAWLISALIEPLREFFNRNGLHLALGLLAFILLFKVGEAFLGRMSIVFYKEVGFSNTQIATYSKLVTWWLTVVFALVAGLMQGRFGVLRGLAVSGSAMAGTNLLFALIAVAGPKEWLYASAVVLDGFTSAWSSVAFVTFISVLCNQTFSATQYALLASLGNLGRTTLSGVSGQVVDWLDGNWALFFVLTTLMIIPSLAILWALRQHIRAQLSRPAEPADP